MLYRYHKLSISLINYLLHSVATPPSVPKMESLLYVPKGEVTQKLIAIVSGFPQLLEGLMPFTLTSFPSLLCLKLSLAKVSYPMPSTYTFVTSLL